MSVISVEQVLCSIRHFSATKVVLGLSGGLDSMVLLELLHQARQQQHFDLQVVYVNHGLSPNADSWGVFCQQQCLLRAAGFQQIHLKLAAGANLEARAREARYGALAEFITAKTHLLMTAHHADDQLETLLLALKRGSGAAGLSGIAPQKPFASGYMVRPLLSVTRQQLQQMAEHCKLLWIEDESNADEQFERNFIRHQLTPILNARWPGFVHTAARSMSHIAALQQLTDQYTEQALPHCVQHKRLNLQALQQYPLLQQDLIIRRWLAGFGLNMQTQWLQTLKQQIIAAKADATPLLQLGDYHIRRFDNWLYLCQPTEIPAAGTLQRWQGETAVTLPGDAGILHFGRQPSAGSLPVALTSAAVSITFGTFSLPFKPAVAQQHKPLKQWLKQWKVPPWRRGSIPLLLVDGKLQLVAGYASAVTETQSTHWVLWHTQSED